MRRIAATLLALAGAAAPAADTPPVRAGLRPAATPAARPVAPMPRPAGPKELPRADRLRNAKDGYQAYCTSWVDAFRRADTEKDRAQLLKRLPNPAPYATQAARLVLEDPADDVAFDALQWLVRYQAVPEVRKALAAVPGPKKGDKAAPLDVHAALLRHHLNNPKLGTLARGLYQHSIENIAFLGTVFDATTDPTVRGFAGQQLADVLNARSEDSDLPAAARDALLREAEAVLVKLLADDAVRQVVLYKDRDGKEKRLGDVLPDALREVRELSVGKRLPDLAGKALDGASVRAADYRGKVLVLDVWATWCGPCRAMIPHEREMVGRLAGKPFALVSISADEEKETVTDFLAKEAMPWVHWWDGKDGPVQKALNVRFYPTVYVIDHKGVIRYKNIRDEKLEEAVNKLLKEQDAEAARRVTR